MQGMLFHMFLRPHLPAEPQRRKQRSADQPGRRDRRNNQRRDVNTRAGDRMPRSHPSRRARRARGANAAKKRRDYEGRYGKRRVEEEEIFYARERDLPAAQFHHLFSSRFRLTNSSNRSSFASSSPTSSTKVDSTGSLKPPSSAPSTSCASPRSN